MSRIITATVGATAILGSLALGASPALAQSPTGGTIKVWVTANATGSGNKPNPIVITGAIADYGTGQNVNSSGKPAANTQRVKLTLKKGTFTVDTSQLNAAFNNANPTDFSNSNCSASVAVGPAAVPIIAGSGTGAYAGISGSVTMSAQVALILPKTKSGACNQSNNANPVAGWGIITGNGTVSFS